MIGSHSIDTRTNVCGTIVKAKSKQTWIELIGSKMLLEVEARPAHLGH
jgi:hypothetical protein